MWELGGGQGSSCQNWRRIMDQQISARSLEHGATGALSNNNIEGGPVVRAVWNNGILIGASTVLGR